MSSKAERAELLREMASAYLFTLVGAEVSKTGQFNKGYHWGLTKAANLMGVRLAEMTDQEDMVKKWASAHCPVIREAEDLGFHAQGCQMGCQRCHTMASELGKAQCEECGQWVAMDEMVIGLCVRCSVANRVMGAGRLMANQAVIRLVLRPKVDALTVVQYAAILDPDKWEWRAEAMAAGAEKTHHGEWLEGAEAFLRGLL